MTIQLTTKTVKLNGEASRLQPTKQDIAKFLKKALFGSETAA